MILLTWKCHRNIRKIKTQSLKFIETNFNFPYDYGNLKAITVGYMYKK